jgi:hypothetical protein
MIIPVAATVLEGKFDICKARLCLLAFGIWKIFPLI